MKLNGKTFMKILMGLKKRFILAIIDLNQSIIMIQTNKFLVK